MECSKCKKQNRTKAQYCAYCSHAFTKKQQEEAYQKTIFYKFDKIEKWYNHLTLKTITDSLPYKIISVLIVLGIGIYFLTTYGSTPHILKDKEYNTYFNQKQKEYYLVVDNNVEKISLNLYIPNRVKSMQTIKYDNDGKVLEKTKQQKDKDILLNVNEDNYYILESTYNKKKHKLKIMIVNEENIKVES